MAVFPHLHTGRIGSRIAIVLGTNEIASAIATRLHAEGRRVVLSHDPARPVLRRGMAFHDALWGDDVALDGVRALCADGILGLLGDVAAEDAVIVTRLGLVDLMPLCPFGLLVDARLHEHAVTPDLRPFAATTIGVGPGFTAGVDCDAAVESRPGLARTSATAGSTTAPGGFCDRLDGHGEERFVRADGCGIWRTAFPIGARVFKGQAVGRLDRETIRSPMDGLLRGLVRDGSDVPSGARLIEVDPRNRRRAQWTGIDAHGRAVAEAVREGARRHGEDLSANGASLSFLVRSSR